jgi:hypothetical protein
VGGGLFVRRQREILGLQNVLKKSVVSLYHLLSQKADYTVNQKEGVLSMVGGKKQTKTTGIFKKKPSLATGFVDECIDDCLCDR